jgi:hypothetical protein
MSDIANADGTSIEPRWLTRQLYIPTRNEYKWPHKHHVTQKDWGVWRSFLKTLCRHNTYSLLYPLGHWQKGRQEWMDTWDCFLSEQEDELFVKQQNTTKWQRHISQPEHRRRHFKRYYKEYLLYEELPSNIGQIKRASYKEHRHYMEVTATEAHHRHRHPTESMPILWSGVQPTPVSISDAIKGILHPVYLETTETARYPTQRILQWSDYCCQ